MESLDRAITIRDLLSHTSGIPFGAWINGANDEAGRKRDLTAGISPPRISPYAKSSGRWRNYLSRNSPGADSSTGTTQTSSGSDRGGVRSAARRLHPRSHPDAAGDGRYSLLAAPGTRPHASPLSTAHFLFKPRYPWRRGLFLWRPVRVRADQAWRWMSWPIDHVLYQDGP